jgi:two-component system sensor histidine kinase QseC
MSYSFMTGKNLKAKTLTKSQQSLRLRLVLGLSLTLCVLWASVAAWMFPTMQRELRAMLDNRLIASAKMVAGLVHQFQHSQEASLSTQNNALLSVIGRDGVACEVSLLRSEVGIIPLARTQGSPDFAPTAPVGFGMIEKGGKPWRSYVLEENGVRIATADRLDVREQLVQSFVYTLVLPFALALLGVVLLSWWITTWCLRPLQQLGQELAQRPPLDPTPVQAGLDTVELAPLTHQLNHLLAGMDAALERERRWTADAAHELRTPLTAIKTHVQVAQLLTQRSAPSAQTEQAAQALGQAHQGIDQLHATLEQLLQLARLEGAQAGQPGPAQTCCGPDALQALQRATQQSLQRAGALPSALQLQTDPALATASAWQLPLAPALLTSAVSNLVDNALRHHQGPGPVCVRAWLEAAADSAPLLHVQVQDQGPGLSAEECALALQRFWRKSASGQGSGLGLTIVQRIAHSVGGTLKLAPRADGLPGLCAQLCLPLQATTAVAQGPAGRPGNAATDTIQAKTP